MRSAAVAMVVATAALSIACGGGSSSSSDAGSPSDPHSTAATPSDLVAGAGIQNGIVVRFPAVLENEAAIFGITKPLEWDVATQRILISVELIAKQTVSDPGVGPRTAVLYTMGGGSSLCVPDSTITLVPGDRRTYVFACSVSSDAKITSFAPQGGAEVTFKFPPAEAKSYPTVAAGLPSSAGAGVRIGGIASGGDPALLALDDLGDGWIVATRSEDPSGGANAICGRSLTVLDAGRTAAFDDNTRHLGLTETINERPVDEAKRLFDEFKSAATSCSSWTIQGNGSSIPATIGSLDGVSSLGDQRAGYRIDLPFVPFLGSVRLDFVFVRTGGTLIGFALLKPSSSDVDLNSFLRKAYDKFTNSGTSVTGASADELELRDNSFSAGGVVNPKLRMSAGVPVTLTLRNTGGAVHNVHVASAIGYTIPFCKTTSDDPCSKPALMNGGATGTITITLEPGTYVYRCDFHPSEMHGIIEVTAP